ncbi:MAG TPA: cytochrome c oxidase subunit II [Candidatus Binatia bacterium]|nr:cytochrome c oxidase subunit II [Candidatus Binatia bacterium]
MAPRNRLRTLLRIGVPLLLIGLLAGCMLPPEPKTEVGRDVFNLYLIVLGLALIVFVGVEGFLLYAVFRYRRKPGDEVLPPQLHGNNTVEIIWTAIPSVIVFILFGFSMATLGEVEARSDNPGVIIEVEGFQWTWTFIYPDGTAITGSAAEPPVMPVPVGEPVRLVMRSIDVNHSFYVPQFLIKRDLINMGENGTPNELEFTITEVGTYAGQCAEFCGLQHADMTFEVDAMERADYDAHMAALAAGEEPPSPGSEDCGTPIQVAAVETIRFDTDSIEVPAGEDFCIEFTNNDTVLHDIGIVEIGFDGDDIGAGESITYVIPAMEAGEYTFICTLHAQAMVGDLTVTE